MIPRIIHYCWFGEKSFPQKAIKCVESWKKYCPQYEIRCWNESNFDCNQNSYLRRTYQNKQYAFLSDFARLKIIEEHGGIYLDTDVELIKPLDELLVLEAYYGFETSEFINTGLGFGAEPHHKTVQEMLKSYDALMDGDEIIGCPRLNTQAMRDLGMRCDGTLQDVAGARIFPQDYFNPFDDPTGKLQLTNNTYSIHWFAKNWATKGSVIRGNLTRPIHRIFGKDFFRKNKT